LEAQAGVRHWELLKIRQEDADSYM
jgi:hypothetical protein